MRLLSLPERQLLKIGQDKTHTKYQFLLPLARVLRSESRILREALVKLGGDDASREEEMKALGGCVDTTPGHQMHQGRPAAGG